MKNVFILTALCFMSSWAQEPQKDPLLDIFELPIFGLDSKELKTIETLLYDLKTLPHETISQALEEVITTINYQASVLENEEKKLHESHKPVPMKTWRATRLLKEQEKHMKAVLAKQPQPTILKKIRYGLEHLVEKTGLYIFQETHNAHNLAAEIMAFITIEREKILATFKSTKKYIVIQKRKRYKLPKIISFWLEPAHKKELLNSSRFLKKNVQTQNFLVEFLIQTAIMMGESKYEGWVSEKDSDYYNQLATEEGKMSDAFTTFQENLAASEQTSITNLSDQFSNAITQLDTQRSLSDTLFTNEIITLNNLFDNSPPKDRYLYDSINFDQAFEISKMLTPANGLPWYNIYPQPNNILLYAKAPNSQTDWIYDVDSDSFYQRNLIPLIASQDAQNTFSSSYPTLAPTLLPDTGQYAHNNTIFCEYINQAASFEIDIDCTVIGVSYPFFVGISFNKARWISGVIERIEQYRLLGLYGTQNSDGSKKVSVCFAEYKYQAPTDTNSTALYTTPLQQIFDPGFTPQAMVDEATVSTLGKNSTTFKFKITTQSTAVTISVSAINNEGKETYYLQDTVINNLNPLLYIYGGIGLLAPGCQAQFTIHKPTALTFNQVQKDDYKTMITTALQSQK